MTKDDLQKFCVESDDVRAAGLGQPWTHGDFTYASNGWICIRVPRLDDVEENSYAPNAEKLFNLARNETAGEKLDWIPVPEVGEVPMLECERCDGTGRFDCPTCEHESDCNDCNGIGKVIDTVAVEINGTWIQKRFLAMVQGWEIFVRGVDKAALIRKGNLRGLVMPKMAPGTVGFGK